MRPRRFLLLCLLLVGGCGPGRGDVTGQVTFQGRPVEVGSVQILPSDKIVRTALIEGGKYTFRNVPAGPVAFSVESPDPLAHRPGGRKREERAKAEAAAEARADKWIPLPPRYASFEQSGLTYELHAGENHHDLVLTP